MDYNSIKDKIRHYLLQQSIIYRRMVIHNDESSINQIARELSIKCNVGQRRLQKYLSEHTLEKELSITIEDLVEFAGLTGQELTQFVAYIFNQTNQAQLKPWETQVLSFFRRLHMALRRDLNCTVLHEFNSKATLALELLVKLWGMTPAQLKIVETIALAFSSQNKLQREQGDTIDTHE